MITQHKKQMLHGAGSKAKLEADADPNAATMGIPVMATLVTGQELLRQFPIGCRKTLYNHCKTGSIPSIVLKGGRRRYFHVESVLAALLRFQKGGVL